MLPHIVESATDWVEVGSLGTFAAALGTVLLAGLTRNLANKTKGIAEETRNLANKTKGISDETHGLADETRRLAKATEEDVLASWRPVVICHEKLQVTPQRLADFDDDVADGESANPFDMISFEVMNVGAGPAMNTSVSVETRSSVGQVPSSSEELLGVIPPQATLPVRIENQLRPDLSTTEDPSVSYLVRVQYEDLGAGAFETRLTFIDPTAGRLRQGAVGGFGTDVALVKAEVSRLHPASPMEED